MSAVPHLSGEGNCLHRNLTNGQILFDAAERCLFVGFVLFYSFWAEGSGVGVEDFRPHSSKRAYFPANEGPRGTRLQTFPTVGLYLGA